MVTVSQINFSSAPQPVLAPQNRVQRTYFGQSQDTVEFSQKEDKKHFWQEHPVATTLTSVGIVAIIALIAHGKFKGKAEKDVKPPKETPKPEKVLTEAELKKQEELANTHVAQAFKFADGDKDFENAEKAISEAIKLLPDCGMFHYYRGNYLVKMNNPKEALKEYETAIKLDPDKQGGFYEAAKLLKKENPQKAYEYIQEALAINPEHPQIKNLHDNIADALGIEHLDHHPNQEIDILNQKIKKDSNNPRLYTERAKEKELIGDYEGAFQDYKKLSEICPEKVGPYRNMAVVRGKFQGYYDEALIYCNEAIKRAPDSDIEYFNKSEILNGFKPKRSQEALEAINKAIEINKTAPECYELRALIHKDLGDEKKAVEDYTKAKALRQRQNSN